MLPYYKRFLVQTLAQVQELRLNPWEYPAKCLTIQETLIKRIIYVENRIRELKQTIKASKKRLGTKNQIRLTKEEASIIKEDIKSKHATIKEYQDILHIFRSIGDALAFIYLPKWDIKPMTLKEDAGFISGKEGFRSELKTFRYAFKKGGIAILNDLTNCLRYTDITLIRADSPPMFLEIKSSKNQNKRVKRQSTESKKLTKYLRTDQMEKDGYLVRRVSTHSIEYNHIEKINTLVSETRSLGHSFKQIEEGLFYYVETEYDENRLKMVMQRLGNSPIVFFLNTLKYGPPGYYPFTLSFHDPETVFDFYQGKLLIFILIDPQVISAKFLNNDLVVTFDHNEDWVFTVQHNNQEKAKDFGPLQVGRHLWGRVGCEFLSLEWFLDEIIHKFNHPVVEEYMSSANEI